MHRTRLLVLAATLFMIPVTLAISTVEVAAADAARGAQLWRACAACHSLRPGDHRSGPSLSGIWNRTAGTQDGFARYSQALADSGIVWTAETLDAWIADPQALVPGNRMTFAGLKSATERADLIAYLRTATAAEGAPRQGAPTQDMVDLKAIGPDREVTGITYCGDTYRVATADGASHPFWEFNLRFKTDSGTKGPAPGRPALLAASMMGDRAFVIFAAPEEIGRSIGRQC